MFTLLLILFVILGIVLFGLAFNLLGAVFQIALLPVKASLGFIGSVVGYAFGSSAIATIITTAAFVLVGVYVVKKMNLAGE